MIIARRYFNALAATSAFMASIAAHRANTLAWPTRPVHLVVPFAAGGPTDVIARIVGGRLSKGWDQQVLIENRPGGGTNIANEMVVRSNPTLACATFARRSTPTARRGRSPGR